MDNKKDDLYYIGKLRQDMEFIIRHMKNVSLDDFEKDELLQDSMMFRLIQISENAKKLSDEYKETNTNVQWGDIYGLRNRLVHEYGHVNMSIVHDTLQIDIPEVLKYLM